MIDIVVDFRRELSLWQQEIEVEANYTIVPGVLHIPLETFFFHFKDGVSTAYRSKTEREQLPSFYLQLAKTPHISKQFYDSAMQLVHKIKTAEISSKDDLEQLRFHVLSLWPYYLWGYNLPRFKEKGILLPNSEIELGNMSFAVEIRKITEGIYDHVELKIEKLISTIIGKELDSRTMTKDEIFRILNGERIPLFNTEKIIDKQGIQNVSLKEFILINNYHILEEEDHSIIIGQVACAGGAKKISGLVKIVRRNSSEDFINFCDNDILVSLATSPVFLPIMKRSLAIITDEGGLTSHAAIISRELNKPCIVGTKIATKVLKDGDLVEVDTEKGIVNIIKKTNS